MKRLDCNQINIFIKLEIIEEEDKNKNNDIYFLKNLKKKNSAIWCSYLISATTTFNLNFYYIIYDITKF